MMNLTTTFAALSILLAWSPTAQGEDYWQLDPRCPGYNDLTRRRQLQQTGNQPAKSASPPHSDTRRLEEVLVDEVLTDEVALNLYGNLPYFQLKMYHEEGFCWQGEWEDRSYCMDCEGASCAESDILVLAHCTYEHHAGFENARDQRFQWVPSARDRTIGRLKVAFADLCLDRYDGNNYDLQPCDFNNVRQLLVGFSYARPFEILAEHDSSRCLNQMHDPKLDETVELTACSTARRVHTNLWEVIEVNGDIPPEFLDEFSPAPSMTPPSPPPTNMPSAVSSSMPSAVSSNMPSAVSSNMSSTMPSGSSVSPAPSPASNSSETSSPTTSASPSSIPGNATNSSETSAPSMSQVPSSVPSFLPSGVRVEGPGEGGIDFCFPSDTVVTEKTRQQIRLGDLNVGDYILTVNGDYTRVYAFGHYAPDERGVTYLSIETNRADQLHISSHHMIVVSNRTAIAASGLVVGDVLLDGSVVVRITPTMAQTGALAPFTEHGMFLVNGNFVVSSYVNVGLSHSIVHFVLPWWFHSLRMLGITTDQYDENGLNIWLPKFETTVHFVEHVRSFFNKRF